MVEHRGSVQRIEPKPVLSQGTKQEGQHHVVTARSRVLIGLVALGLFGSGGYLAWIAFAPKGASHSAALGPGEVHRIRLDGPPQPTAAGEGAAWTAVGTSEDDDLLWRIDAVTEKAEVLPNTRGAGWPAVGEGFAWVTCTGKDNPCSGPSVLKLDPRSGETVATISLPSWPFGITTGLGAVWVSMQEGLARVDPVEEEVTAVFQGNFGKAGIAAGAVWTTSDDPYRVYRLDPATGAVLDSFDLGSPCAIETSEDVVWIETCDEKPTGEVRPELTKIDAHTAEVVFQAPLAYYGQLQLVGESLWTASHPDHRSDVIQVVRLDPESGEVAGEPIRIATGEVRFHSYGPFSPHVFVAADERSLWLADFGAGEVIRLGLPSVAPIEPSSRPTAPGVATPVPGTGLQTVPNTLEMEAEARGESLPWPYCAPDATPPQPPPTAWPPLPPDSESPGGEGWREVLNPIVMALVEVSSIHPLGPREGSTYPLDDVEVRISDVLWQSEFPTASIEDFFPLVEGTTVLVGERKLWIEAAGVLAAGERVVLGIDDAWPDGAYQARYALDPDPDSPTFVGPSPFAERDTGQFRMFLEWEGNPLPSASPVELLVDWNAEVAAPPATYPASGPISISWSRFWDRLTGEDFPMPGTAEWWANAPPQCRSFLDAPDGVVDGLAGGEVFIRVPESWRGLAGGVLCPRISLGSMGCAGLSVQPTWPYVWFDVYAVPGEPIQISIALEKEGAISWVERVVIGLIPFSTFDETGSVRVELDASFSPRSYEDVVAHPQRSNLAVARSITAQESDALIATMP